MLRSSCLAGLVALLVGGAAAADVAEEFAGPFDSWANVKADYGAVGDGVADDTAALQRALDDLRPLDRKRSVLYLPAGTYRITRTLELKREAHSESQGVAVVGEDPAHTTIVWDGPADGVMFFYNGWYSSLGRFTLDGRGKARTALQHGPAFTTANQIHDMAFQDVGFGIEAGMQNGIAETAVERCAFRRCSQAGISIQNWNSLDWWIWDCLFEGCRFGVTNTFGAGNYMVYQCFFRGSTEADIAMDNTMFFAVRDNFSLGSKAFFVAGAIGAGAPTVLQRNLIVRAQDASPIRVGNLGTLQVLDNVVVGRRGDGPAVADIGSGLSAISVGNLFETKEGVRAGRRLISVDDRLVEADTTRVALPSQLVLAPKVEREVIEVVVMTGAAIQEAIRRAAAEPHKRWLIHLPFGSYAVEQTIVVPAGLDVLLVGDGIYNATILAWQGAAAGPVLRLDGPSRAMLCDMLIDGGRTADGIVVDACDQPHARVYTNQLNLSWSEVGLLVDRLADTAVDLRNFQHGSCKVGLRVVGTGEAPGETRPPVVVYCGASSNNEISYDVLDGARLLVRDIWYESGEHATFMRCIDSGQFTMQLGNIALNRSAEQPSVLVDGFRGDLAFLGVDFGGQPGDLPAFVVRRATPNTRVLALGVHGDGTYFRSDAREGLAAMVLAHRRTPGGGAEPIEDVGQVDSQTLVRMLAPTRNTGRLEWAPAPADATSVRLCRVSVSGALTAVRLQP